MMRRGQAYVETVIFLPVFLIVLFGIIWIVQTSVVNERLQFAVRYSGLISNAASPYSSWSLYSLYENTEYPGQTQATRTCYAPASGVLANASPFPGPTSASFWQPTNIGTPSCNQQIVGMDNLSGGPGVFNNIVSNISASSTIPSYIKSIGATPVLQAQQKFFGAPDMRSMLSCYGTLEGYVAGSLENAGGSTTAPPAALPSVPAATSLQSSC
jgi:hypothetical protein